MSRKRNPTTLRKVSPFSKVDLCARNQWREQARIDDIVEHAQGNAS